MVCSPCLWTYVCRTCLHTVINVLGYLFCIFTAPALVVSPEVHADQGRGAVMFPAGFWRAADGDALRSDHLKALWRLLPIQRDGAAIKPHISQTAWWREKKTSRRRRRSGKKEFIMSKDTLRHQSSGKIFYGHTFTPWQGCKLKYTDTLALTHINRLADTPADQRTHALSCMQTPKQPEAKLSAWASIFLQDIFSWGLTHHLNTDQSHWLTFSHLLETKGSKHLWAGLWNVEAPASGKDQHWIIYMSINFNKYTSKLWSSLLWVCVCQWIYFQMSLLIHSPYLLWISTDQLILLLVSIHSVSFYKNM